MTVSAYVFLLGNRSGELPLIIMLSIAVSIIIIVIVIGIVIVGGEAFYPVGQKNRILGQPSGCDSDAATKWTCESCGNLNWEHRDVCNRCPERVSRRGGHRKHQRWYGVPRKWTPSEASATGCSCRTRRSAHLSAWRPASASVSVSEVRPFVCLAVSVSVSVSLSLSLSVSD